MSGNKLWGGVNDPLVDVLSDLFTAGVAVGRVVLGNARVGFATRTKGSRRPSSESFKRLARDGSRFLIVLLFKPSRTCAITI